MATKKKKDAPVQETVVDLSEVEVPAPAQVQTKIRIGLTIGLSEDGLLFTKTHGEGSIIEFLGLLSVADDLIKKQLKFSTDVVVPTK